MAKAKIVDKIEVVPRGTADGIPVWCVFDKIVDVTLLNRNPQNPNMHPESQVQLGARIIKGQGWRACITVSNQSGLITKGHGRLDFALKLGAKEVPVDYQDYATPALEWADVLADNRLSELAEMDILKVKEITDEHLVGHIEMDLCGYIGAELAGRIDVGDEPIGGLKAPDSFKEFEDEQMEFEHTCPKCGFCFS
jgi:hypothetical protein